MIYRITGSKDATIYQRSTAPDRTYQNTGLDSIIELTQELHSSGTGSGVFNSRILLQFENFDSSSLGLDSNPTEYWLRLYNTNADNKIITGMNIDVCVLNNSWEMGYGEFDDNPLTTFGVSWINRDTDTTWTEPGGDISEETGEIVSGSITYPDNGDFYINITSIAEKWNSGDVENNGILIKRDGDEEISTSSLNDIKFFSTDTNTIYQPRLEIMWDDSSWTTGSLSPISISDQISVWMHGLKRNYKKDEKAIIRIYSNERYPAKTFTASFDSQITTKYLPQTSYYSVVDAHTNDVIIPFNTTYTKLSCDSTSNYFTIWMDQFEPLRYYRVLIKSIDSGIEKIYTDSNKMFRVIK